MTEWLDRLEEQSVLRQEIEGFWPQTHLMLSMAEVRALVEIAKAARLIQAFDQAGGNDWWDAHAQLYRALSVLDDREAGEPRD